MRKVLIFISILAYTSAVFSQQATIATTEDGRKVLLYGDGTWRLLKQAPIAEANEKTYQRSKQATSFVKLANGQFGIWFNPSKWKQDHKENDPSNTSFNHSKGDGYALIIAERIGSTVEDLKAVAIKNAKEAAPDMKVVFEEDRMVNGKRILCMRIDGTMQKVRITYYNYYFASDKGAIQVCTFTGTNLFEEFKSDFEEFLNGVQISE